MYHCIYYFKNTDVAITLFHHDIVFPKENFEFESINEAWPLAFYFCHGLMDSPLFLTLINSFYVKPPASTYWSLNQSNKPKQCFLQSWNFKTVAFSKFSTMQFRNANIFVNSKIKYVTLTEKDFCPKTPKIILYIYTYDLYIFVTKYWYENV